MKNCKYFQLLFSLYIDGYLKEKERKKLQEHLRLCENCQQELEKLKKSILIFKSMQTPQIPPDFPERIFRNLERISLSSERNYLPVYLRFSAAVLCIFLILIIFSKNFEREVVIPQKKKIVKKEERVSFKKQISKIPSKKRFYRKYIQAKRIIKPKKTEIPVLAKTPKIFPENVLRIAVFSEKPGNLKIKIFTPHLITWEGETEKESICLLVPFKIKGQEEKDIKVEVEKDGKIYTENFKLLFSEKKPEICNLESENLNRGYVLTYVPFDKKIDCSNVNLVNEVNFEPGKEIDVYADTGNISFLPFSASALSFAPSIFGDLKLVLEKESVDITEFQTILK